MSYQIKSITYNSTPRKILLQSTNGPCPLLACANTLLLRGVITLSPACIRNGVASTEDVINLLANRAMERAGGERSSHHEYQLNEVLSLLPSLEDGMDVNPKFTSPTAVEYTHNMAAFDSLGIELVHGWLIDATEEVAGVVGEKSYNELIELVIAGRDAKEEVGRLVEEMRGLEDRLKGESDLLDVNETDVGNDEIEIASLGVVGSEEVSSAIVADEPSSKSLNKQESESSNSSEVEETDDTNGSTNEVSLAPGDENVSASKPSVEDSRDNLSNKEIVDQEQTDSSRDDSGLSSEVEKEVTSKPLNEKKETTNTESTEQGQSTCNEDTTTITPLSQQDKTNIQNAISNLRTKISTQTDLITKSTQIDTFLTTSSHQLTYHGLERLHSHLTEHTLCVFFRNNHFGTLTKHNDTLYLLATDLGYANTPDIVWEKLDTIDGDTEYVDEVFCKSKCNQDTLDAELLAQQSGVGDYELALALSKNTSAKMDEDEGRLIAAATEASLLSYHGQNGTVATDTNHSESNESKEQSQIDSDREMAMAYQRQQEQRQMENESELLARRLQEMEYANHQEQTRNTARRNVNTVPSARSGATAATGNCVVS